MYIITFWFAVFRFSNKCDIRRLVLTVLSKLRRTPILRRGIGNLRISNVVMGILRKRCLRVRKQRNGQLSLRQLSSCLCKLECGPMPKVMAAQPNIGGALCESSVISFLVPRHKVWLTTAARVPCSNAANIGERKSWMQSEFCTGQNSVKG